MFQGDETIQATIKMVQRNSNQTFFGSNNLAVAAIQGYRELQGIYPGDIRIGFSSIENKNTLIINFAEKWFKKAIDGTPTSFTRTFSPSSKGMMILYATQRGYLSAGLNIASGYVYEFKIWRNDVLVFNLIPALYNNRPCMYDTVSRKPFYNAGTGEFTYKIK